MAVYPLAASVAVSEALPGTNWTRESLQHLLRNSDKAVVRALIQIWHRQTYNEKNRNSADEANGRGFTASDAFALSHMAKAAEDGQSLTVLELAICRDRMMKYTRQLLEVIADNQIAALINSQ